MQHLALIVPAEGWYAVHWQAEEPYYRLKRVAAWGMVVLPDGGGAMVHGLVAAQDTPLLVAAYEVPNLMRYVHTRDEFGADGVGLADEVAAEAERLAKTNQTDVDKRLDAYATRMPADGQL